MLMNVNIKGLHMDMTPALVDYIYTKLKHLEKFTTTDAHVYIECGKTTEHHKTGTDVYAAEIKLRVRGTTYYARVYGADVYNNINAVTHDIVEQVKQKTSKKRSLWKRGAMRIKAMFKRG
jgi:putative sigma-54 modulation protein